MNGWIYIVLASVLVCFEETQSQEWCYKRTKCYSRRPAMTYREKTGRLNHVIPQRRPVRVKSTLTSGSVTAKQFVKMFPGLFLNKTNANELEKGFRQKIVLPQHDGDLHCPTFMKLEAAPENLMNVRQEMKEIVHFSSEGVYQYVHKGKCGSSSTQSCTSGGCHQEKSTVYLMVWQLENTESPATFDAFQVESYCSCKGFTQ